MGLPHSQEIIMLIGEFSRRSGLSRDTVRHYQSLGMLITQQIPAGSRKYVDYPEENLARVETITLGKLLGMNLKEIANILEAYQNQTLDKSDLQEILHKKLKEINQHIQKLEISRDAILHKLAHSDEC